MSRRRVGRRSSSIALLLALLVGPAAAQVPVRAGEAVPLAGAAQGEPPLLAYYYIWFTPTSWQRAKTDYPELGRYSSDEPRVMRQHVRWAKAAGIDGFVVSWKSTPTLDRRLALLTEVAHEEDFQLMIIYQGLDFERDPLPAPRVAADLARLAGTVAGDAAYTLFAKPVVVLSGSWEFSRAEVQSIVSPVQDRLLVLGSERDAAGVQRLAGLVAGNAYYWSSGDPDSPGYRGHLDDVAAATRSVGGMWIAPVAVGYDARVLGGTRVVDRREGDALRASYDHAVRTSPDALGLISWNEFSENSHVEPSLEHGRTALRVLADLDGATAPGAVDMDSSEPGGPGSRRWQGPVTLGGVGVSVLACFLLVLRRGRRADLPPAPPPEAPGDELVRGGHVRV